MALRALSSLAIFAHCLTAQQPAAPVDPRLAPAITSALEFLVKQQRPDGSFPPDLRTGASKDVDIPGQAQHRAGVTGLALLALLSGGSSLRLGPHRAQVTAACRWLVDLQDPEGRFRNADNVLDQAFATMAVVHAYGHSDRYRPFKKPAQLAVDCVLRGRGEDGGWSHRQGAMSDSLSTSLALHVMGAAAQFGLEVKEEHGDAAWRWLDSVSSAETGRPGFHKRGEALVRPPEALALPAEQTELLAAVSLWGRSVSRPGLPPAAVMKAAVSTILKSPPRFEPKSGSVDFLYWFYATASLRQHAGEEWQAWAKTMTKVALEHQIQEGDRAGSWDPVDAWGPWGGRVQATALMVMVLQLLSPR